MSVDLDACEDPVVHQFIRGEVDVLVGNVLSRRVGVLRRATIATGTTNTVTVDLVPGFHVDLHAVCPDVSSVRIRSVRSERHGTLPVYRQERSWGLWHDADEEVPTGRLLGPYPGDEVLVDVVDEAGRVRTHRFRPAAED